jgi:hypothetical protein
MDLSLWTGSMTSDDALMTVLRRAFKRLSVKFDISISIGVLEDV